MTSLIFSFLLTPPSRFIRKHNQQQGNWNLHSPNKLKTFRASFCLDSYFALMVNIPIRITCIGNKPLEVI